MRFASLFAILLAAAAAPAQTILDIDSLQRSPNGAPIIPLTNWQFNGEEVPPFAPLSASYDGTGWVMRPNQTTPHNCFGWLTGPLVSVPKALDSQRGNTAQMRVKFSFSSGFTGTAPAVRLRVNTGDFTQAAEADIPPPRFNELRSAGRGEANLVFDRGQLAGDTTLRLYIDMYQALGEGTTDPNFFFRVENVEFVTTVSNSSYPRNLLLSAAYMEADRDVIVHQNGSSQPQKIRDSVTRFAYDGPFAIVIDGGALYGYSTLRGLGNPIEISDDDIQAAAISDNRVIYLTGGEEVRVFDFLTEQRTTINQDGDYYDVTASGDGTLFVAEESGGRFRLHQWDTRRSDPFRERLMDDYDVIGATTRATGNVNSFLLRSETRSLGDAVIE